MRQQPRALRFTAEAMDLLCCMPWPGNVRQLRNLIDRLAVFAEDDQITPDVLRPFLAPNTETEKSVTSLEPIVRAILRLPVENKLAAIQEALIAEAMALCDGNKSAAARLLGVHRKAVERRVEKGLADDSSRGDTPGPASEGSPRTAGSPFGPRSGGLIETVIFVERALADFVQPAIRQSDVFVRQRDRPASANRTFHFAGRPIVGDSG